MNGQDPTWTPSGDPAQDYKELTRIFQSALAARRAGQDPQKYIDSQLGPGAPPMTLRDLSSAIAHLAQQGGEPMTGGERAASKAEQVAIGASLGLGARALPQGPTDAQGLPLPVSAARTESQVKRPDVFRAAGALLPMTLGGAAVAPHGLAAMAGMQGLMSGTMSAAETPEGQPVSIPQAAKAGAIGAGLSLAGNLALHTAVNLKWPAGTWMEQYVKRAGGEDAINARVQAMMAATPGVTPTLTEALGPEGERLATRVLPRWNANTTNQMLEDARTALDEAKAARAQIGLKYRVLDKSLDTPAVREIVSRDEVQSLLKDLRDAGQGPPDELSAANLNDVRRMLQQEAEGYQRAYERDPSPAKMRARATYQKAANDLRAAISAAVPDFENIQREYAPYAQRVVDRTNYLRRLMGQRVVGIGAGARAMAEPLPGSLLLKMVPTEAKLHANLTPSMLKIRAAADVAPLMFKPVDMGMKGLQSLWPHLGSISTESLGGSAAGAAMAGRQSLLLPQEQQQPQDQNPFFPNQ